MGNEILLVEESDVDTDGGDEDEDVSINDNEDDIQCLYDKNDFEEAFCSD